VLFLLAVTFAYAVLLQPPGCNQTAHYALVQSLFHGSARIDTFHNETCDTAYFGGHYYAAKAPGLAFASLGWFAALDAVDAVPANPSLGRAFPTAMLGLPRRALWQVGLVGAVLPALGLLLLLRPVVERISPGLGRPVAATVGLGTLILPFATVFFSHVLGAFLAFAAFALLFLRRRPLLAGLAAGLAVTVEFPLALVVVALAAYAWPRTARFAAGAVIGIVPLAAFNAWAVGSPFRLSYANAVLEPGKSGHDVLGANSSGFFGIGVPSARVAAELLLSPRGLFILSPATGAAAAGLVLLWRRGFAREAVLAAGLFVAFLVYNAGYYVPFGGYVPGPRFLIVALPFLALGLGPALAAWPAVVAVLAAFSVGAMTVATAAEPLLGSDDTHSWIVRWRHGDFAQSVVTLLGGGHRWLGVAPFLVAVAAAVACAVPALPAPRASWRALAALLAWAVVFLASPDLLHTDRVAHQTAGLAALVVILCALGGVLARADGVRLLVGAPLLVLALPGFASHTKQSLALGVAVLGALAAVELRRRRRAAQPVARRGSSG
jgi:hypothetical protein